MDIGKYCNREVIVTEKDATIIEIAQLMRRFHVGDVVIVEPTRGGNRPIGIVTDRDLVIEILAQDLDPGSVTAKDFMTTDLVKVRDSEDLMDTLDQMRTHGVRRIPVVDEQGDLAGILTVDDALELMAEQLTDLAALVHREVLEEKRQHP